MLTIFENLSAWDSQAYLGKAMSKRYILVYLLCVCSKLKSQFILLFNLFFLLFLSSTAFFGTIHESYYTISVNFYLYLQYFQQKNFSFNKISKSQTNPYIYIYIYQLSSIYSTNYILFFWVHKPLVLFFEMQNCLLNFCIYI